MSVSRGCAIVEIEPGKWWAVVALREYDYDFDDCEAYGPCSSAESADELMSQHTSNPGSSTMYPHTAVNSRLREVFASARKWRGNSSAVHSGSSRRSGPFTFYP